MTVISTNQSEQTGDDAAARRDRFLDLPLDIRWEVTRRHPVYLLCWEGAKRHHDGEVPRDSLLGLILFQQSLLLASIGVTGRPVDPATSAEDVMAGGGPEWQGIAVRPVSMRAICVLLLSTLPDAERLQVADILVRSAAPEHRVPDDHCRIIQRRLAIDQLVKLPSPVLDAFPTAPYFYVHVDASDTSIGREIIEQVRKLRGTPREDRRLRLDKIPGQLAVWDLREGWQGSEYDLLHEQKFADIARDLRISVSTAIDRYKSAFGVIFGVPFSRESWWDHFGCRKYGMAELEGREVTEGQTRWRKSPSSRPVPESSLARANDAGSNQGIASGGAAVLSGAEWSETKLDLETLFAKGSSNAEIADALGFENERREELVAALRARYAEFGELF